ncbi:MAG TPA: hypothetical protein DD641_04490 [Deltaproteobacteria bacterium]|nr:hypothetical protein [Deltaproteobacteria bacterium]
MSIKKIFFRRGVNNFIIFLVISTVLHLILFFSIPEFEHKLPKFPILSVPVEIIDIPERKFIPPRGEIVDIPEDIRQKPAKELPGTPAKRLADRTLTAKKETSPKPIPLPKYTDGTYKAVENGIEAESEKKDEVKKEVKKEEVPATTPAISQEEKKEPSAKEELKVVEKDKDEKGRKDDRREDIIAKKEETMPVISKESKKESREPEKFPSIEKLFPSEQRLSELDKEYQKGVPGIEEGKTLSLNTSEYRYISYLTGIKRKIELVWNYPDAAARAGQQGILELSFTIRKDGTLEEVKLVKSSGYPMLDDEAISAVKLAAPYNPFPKGFTLEKLTIAATFEYIIQTFFYRQVR